MPRTAIALCAVALAACNRAESRPSPPARSARPAPVPAAPVAEAPVAPARVPAVRLVLPSGDSMRVRVEVARSDAERAQGLMFRRSMDEDAGMIFLFDRRERQVFWMRNTYLPLDMLFIDADRRVVGIVENATPLTETSRAVDAPSQFVLEVNAGFCRRHRIGIGTLAEFEGFSAPGGDTR